MIRIKAEKGAVIPHYATEGAAGADISAYLSAPVTLRPGEYKAIPTGLFMEIPEGYEVQVRPRSGLALKHGITVLNAPGTIDSDYRGEVKVILINHSSEAFAIQNGDRIAQIVVARVHRLPFVEVDDLSATERGEGGFGSTGV